MVTVRPQCVPDSLSSPIARLKFSINTSVFLTSELNTSDPTMGQKGTLGPSS